MKKINLLATVALSIAIAAPLAMMSANVAAEGEIRSH